MKRYGSKVPPEYDLSKIKVKVALFHGDVDTLANTEDVQWLADPKQSGLSTVVFKKQYHFDHSSFVMAKDMSFYDNDLIPLIR